MSQQQEVSGMRVWRICNAHHAATAFSGDGARRFSARWNPAGVAMVYTATSLSLAAIEVFVHLGPEDTPDELIAIEAELPVDEASCERIDLRTLPLDWRKERHSGLLLIGAEWARSRRSLALLVPSAVVDGEWNALVNPEHPQAGKIEVLATKPFRFDARMFKTKSRD